MPLEEHLCFVQFMHRGPERRPRRGGVIDWNCGDDHWRKFVEVNGRCCRKGQRPFEGPLRFWTEWEAELETEEVDKAVPDGPRFIQQIFYRKPRSYRGLQNTDPFVFGGFYYMGCKQNKKGGRPTQLRYLKQGSVILFGSHLDGSFLLDTVFVVDRYEEHNASKFRRLRDRLSTTYFDVTFRAWYGKFGPNACAQDCWRLYFGATIERPVDGMFSFFPCMPADASPRGFARPAIEIPEVITNALRQGQRLNAGLDRNEVRKYWNQVRQKVEEGQWLGVHALSRKRDRASLELKGRLYDGSIPAAAAFYSLQPFIVPQGRMAAIPVKMSFLFGCSPKLKKSVVKGLAGLPGYVKKLCNCENARTVHHQPAQRARYQPARDGGFA